MDPQTPTSKSRPAFRSRTRKILKRLPRRSNIDRYPGLRFIARWTSRYPELWSYRAPYTTRAYYVGSVVTFLPIMGAQILVGTLLALVFRANLTITAGLQLVSNPLTGPFMYYLSYKAGAVTAPWLGIGSLGLASEIATNLTIGGVLLGLLMGVTLDVADRLMGRRTRRLSPSPA